MEINNHSRKQNVKCIKCIEKYPNDMYLVRNVKTPPKLCLPKEYYHSVHLLCRPCWKKYRNNFYDNDKKLLLLKDPCYICSQVKCIKCGSIGHYHDDLKKVLCYDCL
jgi:hypothetical protein